MREREREREEEKEREIGSPLDIADLRSQMCPNGAGCSSRSGAAARPCASTAAVNVGHKAVQEARGHAGGGGGIARKRQSMKTSKGRVEKKAQGSSVERKAIWTGTTVAV